MTTPTLNDKNWDFGKWAPLISIFMERNNKINLSAIRNEHEIYEKHILDALEIHQLQKFPVLSPTISSACDLGTGWGFPLLPLAHEFPDIHWTWLDARAKKINAIKAMISHLQLDNCSAVHWRAEESTQTYDLVTARAVAYSDTLVPRINQLVWDSWHILLYKKFSGKEDSVLLKIAKKHHWKLLETHLYDDKQKKLYLFHKA